MKSVPQAIIVLFYSWL